MPDTFTTADAERMSQLFQQRDDDDLTDAEHAELLRLVERWTHAVYLDVLALVPPDWQPPELTEALVRKALREG